MSKQIKIGICGYGNLGRGVEFGIKQNPDMELVAVFTRRIPPESVQILSKVPVVHIDFAKEWKDKIDIMILCGGSASDLPVQGPMLSKLFNTIDSFDTHAKIPTYLKEMDTSAKDGNHLSIISVGWDPGLFSLMRLYLDAILPQGQTHTFWGAGVSQGHSDAVRRIEGVENAVQYTVPTQTAIEQVRSGKTAELTTRQKHTRVCYVVPKAGVDKARIEREIQEMPHYFDGYDTTVHFVSAKEFEKNHAALPHGGSVIRTGETGMESRHTAEFNIKLDSNPEFTASILLAYARAAHRLFLKGERGAKTVFDIPPAALIPSIEEAIKELL